MAASSGTCQGPLPQGDPEVTPAGLQGEVDRGRAGQGHSCPFGLVGASPCKPIEMNPQLEMVVAKRLPPLIGDSHGPRPTAKQVTRQPPTRNHLIWESCTLSVSKSCLQWQGGADVALCATQVALRKALG